MNQQSRNIRILMIVVGASITTQASAAIRQFTVHLSGGAANACAGTGSTGTGSGTFTLDDVTGDLTYEISVSGLGSAETVAHVHGAASSCVDASPVYTLPPGSTKIGGTTLTAPQIADMLDTKHYVNVHTTGFPNGELRGQILLVSDDPGVFLESDVEVLYSIDGLVAGEQLGFVAEPVGDLNGDGVQEFLASGPAVGRGRIYLYHGRTGELLRTHQGITIGGFLGFRVVPLGDIDNDGISDYGGSASGPLGGGGTGEVFVWSGDLSLSGGAELLYHFLAEAPGDKFGYGAGGLDDINNDGFRDIIIGAPRHDAGGILDAGRVRIYSGADGTILRTHDGTVVSGRLGTATRGVSDLNGDGVGDYIVGADRENGGVGKAYVHSGATGAVLYELFPSSLTASAFGGFFANTIGDATGDGVGDLYLDDWQDSAQGNSTGRAYVFDGATGDELHVVAGESGGDSTGFGGRLLGDVNDDGFHDFVTNFGHAPDATAMPSGGRVRIYSGKDGRVLRTITSLFNAPGGPGEFLGTDVTGIGDVNDDGLPDLLVTATTNDVGGIAAGRVYVIAGVVSACTLSDPVLPDPSGINKSRFASVVPPQVSGPAAIRVTMTDLNGFGSFNGEVRWAGPPVVYVDDDQGNPGGTFVGAALQCEPHFRDWSTVGVLHMFGAEVIPSSTYEITAIHEDCATETDIEGNFAESIVVNTGRWGDAVAPYFSQQNMIQPNFVDINAVVGKFLKNSGAPSKTRTQLQPNVPNPTLDISFLDIAAVIASFLSQPYSYAGPVSCP